MGKSIDLEELLRASVIDGRVDVVGLAKKLGLEVYSKSLPNGQSGHLTIDINSHEAYIEVNRNQPITRQRFTIAHEIGHYLNHRPALEAAGQLDRALEYKSTDEIRRETEADKEAAGILMPPYIVSDYFEKKSWGKNTRFDSNMISEIADQFRVSRTMAVTRLRELGYPIPFLTFA